MLLCLSVVLLFATQIVAFSPPQPKVFVTSKKAFRQEQQPFWNDNNDNDDAKYFDPLDLSSKNNDDLLSLQNIQNEKNDNDRMKKKKAFSTALITLFCTTTSSSLMANAATTTGSLLNPQNFQPVCPVSDSFYRFLQSGTLAVVGQENFDEYGPLIAGGLLRVRLELCVVESFFNEAIGPFIQQNGLSWILPLHETVETFIAGTIFALATTFILVGSTKILTVLITYTDLFVGGPCRIVGGYAYDRAVGKPITVDFGLGPFKTRVVGPAEDDPIMDESNYKLDILNTNPLALVIVLLSGAVKLVGETCKLSRDIIEALDLFVGRYLVLLATGYIGLKFLHFKIFPDFPNFDNLGLPTLELPNVELPKVDLPNVELPNVIPQIDLPEAVQQAIPEAASEAVSNTDIPVF